MAVKLMFDLNQAIPDIERLDRDGCLDRWRDAFCRPPPKYLSPQFMNRVLIWDLQNKELDTQREACEADNASQKHEGWELLPDRYDDGGISGGRVDRPALQRLMRAAVEKRIDQIVVHKIDRLTRSLPNSNVRSRQSASGTSSPLPRGRACGWVAAFRSDTRRMAER